MLLNSTEPWLGVASHLMLARLLPNGCRCTLSCCLLLPAIALRFVREHFFLWTSVYLTSILLRLVDFHSSHIYFCCFFLNGVGAHSTRTAAHILVSSFNEQFDFTSSTLFLFFRFYVFAHLHTHTSGHKVGGTKLLANGRRTRKHFKLLRGWKITRESK